MCAGEAIAIGGLKVENRFWNKGTVLEFTSLLMIYEINHI